MPNATADELRPYVEQWHAQALPLIRTKDFGASWDDFVVAWGAVKYPIGASLCAAVAQAENVQLVGVAAGYTGTLRRMAQLCAALQAQAGDKPFFLGCRTAGTETHTSAMDAWRQLKRLKDDGVLVQVKKGTKRSKRANTWRFNQATGQTESNSP
jgi:hypothetical protein